MIRHGWPHDCPPRPHWYLPRRPPRVAVIWFGIRPRRYVGSVSNCPPCRGLPPLTRPVYSASRGETSCHVVLDVPACGYAWVQGGGESRGERQTGPALASSERLANEYIEAYVHPGTGALQSFRAAGSRDNLLSQQIAFRFPRVVHGPEGDVRYSVMAADSVTVTAATTTMGEITSRGRLCDPRRSDRAFLRSGCGSGAAVAFCRSAWISSRWWFPATIRGTLTTRAGSPGLTMPPSSGAVRRRFVNAAKGDVWRPRCIWKSIWTTIAWPFSRAACRFIAAVTHACSTVC